jgi:hypothetical protein
MRPLAERLTAQETGGVTWSGGDPGGLSPELTHDGESSIDPEMMLRVVLAHLAPQGS